MPRRQLATLTGERNRRRSLRAKKAVAQRQEIVGHYSQHSVNIDYGSPGIGQTLHPFEGKQILPDVSNNVVIIHLVPDIKKEIVDPFEQNEEFILPDRTQHATPINSTSAMEVQDSCNFDELVLKNIKVEPAEMDDVLNEPSRTEQSCESVLNFESKNFLTSKYKLKKCSVLLHDCLIPENFASISKNFKSLKIKKDYFPFTFSNTFRNTDLFPFRESPLFSHITYTYKKSVSPKKKKIPPPPPPVKVISFSNAKKKKVFPCKVDRVKSNYICNCINSIYNMSEFEENYEPTQQLCSCATNDHLMSEDRKLEEISIYDPNFGKIK